MKNKRPASMLISAILASVMFIIIANSFMNLWGNSFTTLTAAKTATEAQNLSDIVSEKLKLEGVDAEEVTTKTPLSDITGNDDDDDWLYTYEIGNEFEDDDGNIFKVAEVKIYKDGEDNPRYSTEIPLSSETNSKMFLEIFILIRGLSKNFPRSRISSFKLSSVIIIYSPSHSFHPPAVLDFQEEYLLFLCRLEVDCPYRHLRCMV